MLHADHNFQVEAGEEGSLSVVLPVDVVRGVVDAAAGVGVDGVEGKAART